MSRVSTGAKELVLEVKRGRNMVTQGRKSRWNQGGSWNAGTEKPDPYCPSLLYVVTINGFQVLLSSISCLPLNPWGEGICLTLHPTEYMCLIQSANDPQDPYPTPCTPGIKVSWGPLFNGASPLNWPAVLTAAAAAAKSLQSCPTLRDPTDGSPPGPAVPGILQARTLEWVAISSSNAWKWKVKVKSLSRVRLLATPGTAVY